MAVAIAEGVHSARAKRLFVTRIAERRGLTTLAPLLQVALPTYHDVRARVRFSAPVRAEAIAPDASNAEITARVRTMALRLVEARR